MAIVPLLPSVEISSSEVRDLTDGRSGATPEGATKLRKLILEGLAEASLVLDNCLLDSSKTS
jgi:hypothetical protein